MIFGVFAHVSVNTLNSERYGLQEREKSKPLVYLFVMMDEKWCWVRRQSPFCGVRKLVVLCLVHAADPYPT